MDSLGKRVAHARALAGISQSELARRIGIKPQSIQAIEAGDTKRSRYTGQIARTLGVDEAWLDMGRGEVPSMAHPAPEPHEAAPAPHRQAQFVGAGRGRPHERDMIPILSAARGGTEQTMFSEDPVGYTPRPSNLEGIKGAYAIYMVGDSMSPRYEPGWILHVNPFKPPKPGRGVVVEKQNGAVLVKLYVGRRNNSLLFRSVNPDYPDELCIAEAEIRNMHLIVGSNEEG
jgi:phage repressor protein C with HTH and peptisase S24 domain